MVILFFNQCIYAQPCDSNLNNCLNTTETIEKTQNLAINATNQLKLVINTIENQIDDLRKRQPFNALGKQLIVSLFMVIFIWSVIKNMLLKPVINQIIIGQIIKIYKSISFLIRLTQNKNGLFSLFFIN